MTKSFLFKLKCGEDELNLTDWITFYPLAEGHREEGETVTVPLYVKTECHQSAAIAQLMHQIEVYNQRAFEYEDAQIGQPVLLGMKLYDGNTYDTVFGRGWVWKYFIATAKQKAIEVQTESGFDNTIGAGYIASLTLVFHCKPRIGYAGAQIYAWEPLHERWIGNAYGAVTPLENGGILVEKAAATDFINSDFEYEIDRDYGWTADAGLTATAITDEALVFNGFASMKLACLAGADRNFYQTWTAPSTNTYCISFYAKYPWGSVTSGLIRPYYGGGAVGGITVEPSDVSGWHRVWGTITGVAAPNSIGCTVEDGETLIVDSFQIEESFMPSTYIYGNLGRGYAFSGAEHITSSVRNSHPIAYINAEGTSPRILPQDKATILVVWKCPATTADLISNFNHRDIFVDSNYKIQFGFHSTATGFRFSDDTTNVDATYPLMDKDDIIFIFCRYGPSGLGIRLYHNNELVGSATSVNYIAPTPANYVYIGGNSGGSSGCGEILEMQVWPEELTELEMQKRVSVGCGRGEFPFMYVPYVYLVNCWLGRGDSGRLLEFDNVPGDMDAGLKLFLSNVYGSHWVEKYLYWGQMRRAVARDDIPSKRHLRGCFYSTDIEAEAGSATYDGDTTTAADASASPLLDGYLARVNPSSLEEVKRIEIPICNEPEDLWKWVGRWRLLAKLRTQYPERFRVRFRAVVANQPGDYTEQEYANGDNVWRVLTPTYQIVTIPTAHVPAETIQRYCPGHWDSAIDGPYAYLEVYVQAESLGGVLDIDCIVFIPQDQEAFAKVPQDVWGDDVCLMTDTTSPEFAWALIYGWTVGLWPDWEEFVSGFDFSGARFTLGVGRPNAMAFLWRRNDTGGSIVMLDLLFPAAKYKPRYWMLQ